MEVRRKVPSLAAIKWHFVSEWPHKPRSKAPSSYPTPAHTTARSGGKKPSKQESSITMSRSDFSISRSPQRQRTPPHDDAHLGSQLNLDAFKQMIDSVHIKRQSVLNTRHAPRTPQFPMTEKIRSTKTLLKNEFKPSPQRSLRKLPAKNHYNPAWYLPPEQYKQAPGGDQKLNEVMKTKSSEYADNKPYFFLHVRQKGFSLTLSNTVLENVQKLQKMPMISKFKGYLERTHHRVPMFLDSISSDNVGVSDMTGERSEDV